MAGTFVGVAGVQQFQVQGSAPPYGSVPMAGGYLTVFLAGSTTLASCFQDVGLSTPAANPMILDVSGRVPQFYVADGFYRLRLTAADGTSGNGGFDYPQVPSIGAATSGGGGSGVDPTTIFSTGFTMWQPLQGLVSGFVRMNGRTIGSASSGGSERANADCNALFQWIWNNILGIYCPVIGGRGANSAVDWAVNKQITLPDLRGRAPWGLDDMGNAAAGILSAISTSSPTTPASPLGFDNIVLVPNQMPSHNHGGLTGIENANHTHSYNVNLGLVTVGAGGGVPEIWQSVGTGQTGVESATHQHSISGSGGNGAHNNMSPAILGSWFIKL